jgi:hypothetical protein
MLGNVSIFSVQLSPDNRDTLRALANGIVPPDVRDDGANAVDAAGRLAARMESGAHQALYVQGIEEANKLAQREFQRSVAELLPEQIHQLLGALRDELPAFFKQLRMDVSALYLSDPSVWRRIGFPGPSIASGGYPDFDQPQKNQITELKEPLP